MDPGKARMVPLPMRLRRRDDVKVAPTEYLVPSSTERKIFIICCRGNARETPRGTENRGDRKTTAAAIRAAAVHARRGERKRDA